LRGESVSFGSLIHVYKNALTFEPKRLDVLLETSRRFFKSPSRLSEVLENQGNLP
jgi:hypothetical protein